MSRETRITINIIYVLVVLSVVVGINECNSPRTSKSNEIKPEVEEEFRPATAGEYRFAIAEVLKEKDFKKIVGESHYSGLTIFTFKKTDGKYYVAVFKGKERMQ
jgi:hypothetical protein